MLASALSWSATTRFEPVPIHESSYRNLQLVTVERPPRPPVELDHSGGQSVEVDLDGGVRILGHDTTGRSSSAMRTAGL